MICIGGAVTLTVYKGVAIFKLSPTEDLDGHSFLHLFNHLDLSTPALQMNSPYALPLGVLCVIGKCCVWAMFLIKQVHSSHNIFLETVNHLFVTFTKHANKAGQKLNPIGFDFAGSCATEVSSSLVNDMHHAADRCPAIGPSWTCNRGHAILRFSPPF